MKNYHQILGVSPNASEEEIKKAYKKLAKENHPDRFPSDKHEEANKRFKEINEAYEILVNKKNQSRQDHQGNPFDLFNIFRQQFSSRRESGKHIAINLELTLEEVLQGGIKSIYFNRPVLCPACNGYCGEKTTCQSCNGRGMEAINFGYTTCTACHGRGFTIIKDCIDCKGKGFQGEKEERVDIDISDARHGAQIAYQGAGAPAKFGGMAGHLLIYFIFKEHEILRRHGEDLYYEAPVKYTDLVFGTELDIPTLDGSYKVKIPAGTSTTAKFRNRGQGLPIEKDLRGDFYVTLKLDIPKELSAEEQKVLKKLQKLEQKKTI